MKGYKDLALILLTCVVAHLFPYHLVIFSYTVLGPAHYLTQISWLHDRKYFAHSNFLGPALALLSCLLTLAFFYHGNNGIILPAIILGSAVGLTILLTLPLNTPQLRQWIPIIAALPLILIFYSMQIALVVAFLLPSVIHIFFFTASFMWVGATKSHQKTAYLPVIALLVCAATYIIPWHTETLTPNLTGIQFFKPIVIYLQYLFGLSSNTQTQLFGFLSFAYTYHYLNWFSKAEVIRWNQVSRERMSLMILLYIATLTTYAIDYTTGFYLILLLSFMHVILEFPLNMRTFILMCQKAPSYR